jgi:hypothetical protein
MRAIALTRVALIPALFAILVGCATVSAHDDASTDAVVDGADFTMQPGAQVALADGSNLRYLRVLDDSRCKPDVQCVWAGDAELAFQWTPSGRTPQDFSLHTGKAPRDHVLGGRRLTLVSLTRGAGPSATLRVELAPAP